MTPQDYANRLLAEDQARRRGGLHDQFCRCRGCKPSLVAEAELRRGITYAVLPSAALWALAIAIGTHGFGLW